MRFFLLLFHVYHGLTWSSPDDLSLVMPNQPNDDQFYVIRDHSDQSVHVDIFHEDNTVNYTAVTLDTETDTVTQAVLINDTAYFLTDNNELIAFHNKELFRVGDNDLTNFDNGDLKMMAFPHNVTNASPNHQFLVFLHAKNSSHQELYVGSVDYNETETHKFKLELSLNSTIDLTSTDHDEFTSAISITQAAVNLVIAGGKIENGNVDLGMYKTRGLNQKPVSTIDAEVAGLIDADNNTISLETSGSSSIGLTVSQGVTGGMFIYSTRAALYSMYDGDYPEKIIDHTTQGK